MHWRTGSWSSFRYMSAILAKVFAIGWVRVSISFLETKIGEILYSLEGLLISRVIFMAFMFSSRSMTFFACATYHYVASWCSLKNLSARTWICSSIRSLEVYLLIEGFSLLDEWASEQISECTSELIIDNSFVGTVAFFSSWSIMEERSLVVMLLQHQILSLRTP